VVILPSISRPQSYEVGDDMTFGQLIADGLDENLSVELLQNWYLVDEGKGACVFVCMSVCVCLCVCICAWYVCVCVCG